MRETAKATFPRWGKENGGGKPPPYEYAEDHMIEPKNNYAVMVERARALFRTHDRAAMCARLGLPVPAEDGDIPIRFLGGAYRVRLDGTVLAPDGAPAGFNAAMAIYDALARDNLPRLSGQFVPTAALHRIHGTHAVHEDLNAPAAARFAGRAEDLEAALIARGGRRWGPGDVSYIIDVFDFFPVCVRFYDADEEFPASLQFLWDSNAPEFLYYETLWYVMGEITEQLSAAVGE